MIDYKILSYLIFEFYWILTDTNIANDSKDEETFEMAPTSPLITPPGSRSKTFGS